MNIASLLNPSSSEDSHVHDNGHQVQGSNLNMHMNPAMQPISHFSAVDHGMGLGYLGGNGPAYNIAPQQQLFHQQNHQQQFYQHPHHQYLQSTNPPSFESQIVTHPTISMNRFSPSSLTSSSSSSSNSRNMMMPIASQYRAPELGRPRYVPPAPERPSSANRSYTHGKTCSNCQIDHSTNWRKHPHNGNYLCNACGLYFVARGKPRPVKTPVNGGIGIYSGSVGRPVAPIHENNLNMPNYMQKQATAPNPYASSYGHSVVKQQTVSHVNQHPLRSNNNAIQVTVTPSSRGRPATVRNMNRQDLAARHRPYPAKQSSILRVASSIQTSLRTASTAIKAILPQQQKFKKATPSSILTTLIAAKTKQASPSSSPKVAKPTTLIFSPADAQSQSYEAFLLEQKKIIEADREKKAKAIMEANRAQKIEAERIEKPPVASGTVTVRVISSSGPASSAVSVSSAPSSSSSSSSSSKIAFKPISDSSQVNIVSSSPIVSSTNPLTSFCNILFQQERESSMTAN